MYISLIIFYVKRLSRCLLNYIVYYSENIKLN